MTILNTYQYFDGKGENLFFMILFGIITVVALCGIIGSIWSKNTIVIVGSTVCFALMLAVTLLCYKDFMKQPITRIQVVLSSDYSATELLEKYKVIAHEGDLWTLEQIK